MEDISKSKGVDQNDIALQLLSQDLDIIFDDLLDDLLSPGVVKDSP